MSINGIGYSGILRPQTGAAQQGQRGERPSAPVQQQTPPASLGIAQASAVPPGADPELWSVLTSEEKQFFEKAQSLGPVTYGPGQSSSDPAMPRGSRLDLRV